MRANNPVLGYEGREGSNSELDGLLYDPIHPLPLYKSLPERNLRVGGRGTRLFFHDEATQFSTINRGDSDEIALPVLDSNSDCFTDLNA